MNCGNCGNPLEAGATFCNKCGTPVLQTETKEAKKKNTKVLVIVLLIVFLAIGIALGFFIGKSLNNNKCLAPSASEFKKEDADKEEDKKDDKEKEDIGTSKHTPIDISNINSSGEGDYGKKIEVMKYYYDEKGHTLNVLAKNNNTVPVNYTVYLNYLDATGTRIDRGLSNGFVEPGKTFVARLYNSTKDDFKSVSITVEASAYKSYYFSVPVDKKVEIADSDNGVIVTYKNDTENELSVYLSIVYYKNNEIIYFDSGAIVGVKPGLTDNTKFSIYNLPGYEYGKEAKDLYDKYEVIVDAGFYYTTDY